MVKVDLFLFVITITLLSITCNTAFSQTANASVIPASLNQSERQRIIGGVETARNEFPFIVSFSRNRKHFCGGAVIDNEWVLTAAHCASEPDFWVTAGEHDLNKNEGTEQTAKASLVIRHPNYNPVTYESDICLVKVSKPFDYTNYVKAFAVPSTHFVATGNATVAGWGTVDEVFQEVSPVLRKVTVPIVNAIECSRQYGKNFVPHKMICAGEEEGGKDACQGDSGGPLMCDDNRKGATLCGIVSFGLGCARPELAGVYTKVAMFSDWVEYEIRKSGSPDIKKNTPLPKPPATKTTPIRIAPENPVPTKRPNGPSHRDPEKQKTWASANQLSSEVFYICICILYSVFIRLET